MRALDACGHADWRLCKYCKQYGDPATMHVTSAVVYHRPCAARESRQRRAAKRVVSL
jgi:hypothetical protein